MTSLSARFDSPFLKSLTTQSRSRFARILVRCALTLLALFGATAVYAQNAYVPNQASNSVSAISTATNAVVATITVGTGPQGVATSADGSRVYVGNYNSSSVSVINTASNSVVATVSVGNHPNSVAVTPNGAFVYVDNYTDGTVSAINASTNTVAATISLPAGTSSFPFFIAASSDGSTVYVTGGSSDSTASIWEISTSSNTVTGTISSPLLLSGFAVSPDGKTGYGTGEASAAHWLIFDLHGGSLTSNVTLGSPVTACGFVTLSGDGMTAYVAGIGGGSSNVLIVVNPFTGSIISTISTGGVAPVGISITPDSKLVYATLQASNAVDAISTATNTVVSTVSVGTSPVGYGVFIQPPPVQNAELLGPNTCHCDAADASTTTTTTGQVFAGEPIDVLSGNVTYQTTDYTTAGQNPMAFTRYYNSRSNTPGIATFAGSLGVNWRSTFDKYLQIDSSTKVIAESAGGRQYIFTLVGTTWTPNGDVDVTLTKSGTTWTLTNHDDTVETYTTTSGGNVALLSSVALRNGYTQTLTYNGSNQLTGVADSYSRGFTLTYNSNGTLDTLATPDSTTITYGYNSVTGGVQLTSVTFPTSPASSVSYAYATTGLPFALTGITDEDGNAYAQWTYDSLGRGLTSALGGSGVNASLTTMTYKTNGTTTVQNPQSVQDTYTFASIQYVPKVTGISRAATSTTVAATESFGYDSNGYLNSFTDWNGNQSAYVNNSHGLPTTINEAVGSSVARTTTIVYDSTWVHLPDTVTTPGVTTTFAYDSNGNVHTKTDTDTTTTTTPYSTNGQARTWTYGYTNHFLTSVQTPRTDVTAITTYVYGGPGLDSSTLGSITDALGHVTTVTLAQTGGYPQNIVDPNGVSRGYARDARQRLVYDVVFTSGGNYTTYYNLDPTGEISQINPPDGTYRNFTHDTAHRLTKISDPWSNYIQYTLDALSDTTQAEIESGPTEYANHTATFDALGRKLTDVGGAGQTTTFTYDKNGNALTIKDGLGNTTTRVFDALNRLSKSTDANSGIAQLTYDAHNRLLTVEDQNSHTTSYVYDGFGDVIQQTSPDTGTTVYHYDNDGNLTSKTDAASVVTNQTFDKLDRVLTTTYPADSTENVAYTYDQTGTGFTFGIGRLTSVTDAAGSLTRAYDERGNLLTEKRVNSGNTYTTSYTYNPASRLLSTTYPDGTVVNFAYDTPGRVYTMSATPAGAGSATTIAPTINYFPFGAPEYISYGNGMTETWFSDLDYRVTSIHGDIGPITGTQVMLLAYAYDAANNLKTITDYVNSANSQTLGYDVLNRVNSAVSGTGGYGTLGWTYDAVGNLLTRVSGGTTYTHTYNTGTNQDAGATWPSNTETFSYTAAGNINGETLNGTSIFTATYNKANRLSTESGSAVSNAVTGIVYDAFGRRFSKAHSSGSPELYFYDQSGEVIEENISGTDTDYVWVDGIQLAVVSPTASPSTNQIAYVLTDRMGTPQMVFSSASTPTNIWSNTYQPYGQGGIPVSSIVNDVRLPGQIYDAETGFHYNTFRDYIPSLGRYLEADPIGLGGGLNTYAYARGNPLAFIDRTGLWETEPDAEPTNASQGVLSEQAAELMRSQDTSETVAQMNQRRQDAEGVGKDTIAIQNDLNSSDPGVVVNTPNIVINVSEIPPEDQGEALEAATNTLRLLGLLPSSNPRQFANSCTKGNPFGVDLPSPTGQSMSQGPTGPQKTLWVVYEGGTGAFLIQNHP